jgi:hypothetical protein
LHAGTREVLKCAALPSSTYCYVRKDSEDQKDKDLVQTIGEIREACNGKYGSRRTMTAMVNRIAPDISGSIESGSECNAAQRPWQPLYGYCL